MTKALICLLVFLSFSQQLLASDKAFAVLVNYGLREDDLVSIIKKYPELRDLDVVAENNYLAHEESDQAQVKIYSDKGNDAYIISKSGERFNVEKIEMQYEVEVMNVEGSIQGSLYESIMNEINSSEVAFQVSEAFKEEFTTAKGLRAKAYFSFQIEQFFDHGQFIKYGNVLNASLIIGKAIIKKAYQMNPESFTWMLLPESSGNIEKPFYLPIDTLRITSVFQLNRRHPVTRKHQPHNGIDFAAPSGSPVYPALEGEVVTISRTRSKGKFITILHDNGYLTTYIHLKKFQPKLRVGMRVELGDQIGEVGRTGYATGAHLHFGVIREGYFVNPIYLLKGYSYNQKDQHEGADETIGIAEKNIIDGELPQDDIEE